MPVSATLLPSSRCLGLKGGRGGGSLHKGTPVLACEKASSLQALAVLSGCIHQLFIELYSLSSS